MELLALGWELFGQAWVGEGGLVLNKLRGSGALAGMRWDGEGWGSRMGIIGVYLDKAEVVDHLQGDPVSPSSKASVFVLEVPAKRFVCDVVCAGGVVDKLDLPE